MMKVTVSVHGRWHAFDLASELHERGYLSQLLTTYPAVAVKKITGRSLPVRSIPLLEFRRRVYDRWKLGSRPDSMIASAFGRFARRMVVEDTDIFVGWSSASLEAIPIVQARGGKVVLERGSTHILHQLKVLEDGYEALDLSFDGTDPQVIDREIEEYDLANAISVPTKFVRDTFVQKGVPADKIIINPYGSHLGQPSALKKVACDGPLKILFVGSVGVRKGAPWLIESMKLFDKPAVCRFAGPVEQAIKHRYFSELPSQVKFLGPLSSTEISRELKSADIFCLPSLEEGFPLSLLEAMSAGTACVVTPPASGGIIQDGKNGLIVPAMDPTALAVAFDNLFSSPKKIIEMGAAASAAIKNGLSWKEYGNRAVAAYESLLV